MSGLKKGAVITDNLHGCSGINRHWYSFTHGISPIDDNEGVAEWQTSSVPISAFAPWSDRKGKAGETTMLRAIARRTITACHFMVT